MTCGKRMYKSKFGHYNDINKCHPVGCGEAMNGGQQNISNISKK